MSQRRANSATRGMSTTAGAKVAMRGRATAMTVRIVGPRGGSALDEFETVYRANVEVVMAYFARRCPEPQTVADLTSEIRRRRKHVRELRSGQGLTTRVAIRDRCPRLCAPLRARRQRSRGGRATRSASSARSRRDRRARGQDRRRACWTRADRPLPRAATARACRNRACGLVRADAEGGRGFARRVAGRASQAAVTRAEPAQKGASKRWVSSKTGSGANSSATTGPSFHKQPGRHQSAAGEGLGCSPARRSAWPESEP